MKDFLKNIFAAFIGVALFCGVAIAISIIGIVGMAFSAGSSSTVPSGSVLVLNLSGSMQDQASDATPFDMLNGNTDGSQGMADMISAIKKAKDSDKIKGIYIEANGMSADLAQLQEIREALLDFKSSKKWIVAYGDQYTTSDYYLASVADRVYLNPQGMVDWHGIGGKMLFVKDMLAKVGVKVTAFKCGKYKSATEMFTEDKMSDPSREQAQRYIGQWWDTIKSAVAQSRHINKDSLDNYADRLVTFEDPQNFVKYKFVDQLAYSDELQDIVRGRLGIGKDDDIPQATVDDMLDESVSEGGGQVAVYYASGDIVDSEPSQSYLQDANYIVADDVCKDLKALADDDDVKAVVLRVNSPGGSAYASEQIWHAIDNLKVTKPVVVSMGGYAASGGYYISCGADYIFAEPTTITGSIGIFGIIPDGLGLTQKLGIKFDEVKTNRNTNMDAAFYGMLTQPFTPEQAAIMQGYINRGYRVFKSRVSAGRHLSMDAVEQRAQGHVFTGADAVGLKLVDGIGGLDMAVRKAAKLAHLDDYYAQSYPAPENFLSRFMSQTMSNGNYLDSQMRLLLGEYYAPVMQLRLLQSMDGLQARMPYILMR